MTEENALAAHLKAVAKELTNQRTDKQIQVKELQILQSKIETEVQYRQLEIGINKGKMEQMVKQQYGIERSGYDVPLTISSAPVSKNSSPSNI